MSTITEANNLGDLLKYEAPNRYSRDVATIAAGQNLPLGTVLGRKTDDGKHYAIDPAATDGTEDAIGVLANEVDGGVLATSGLLPFVRSGKITGLAVTSSRRSRLAPELPTVAELGPGAPGWRPNCRRWPNLA